MSYIWLIPCGPDADPTMTVRSIGIGNPIMLVNDGCDLSAFYSYKNIQITTTGTKGTGCAHALNVGINALKDQRIDWVYRMDADDMATYLHDRNLQASKAQPEEVVIAGAMVTPDGRRMEMKLQSSDDIRSMIERRRNPIYHPATIIRMSALLQVGGYPEQYGQAEDYGLWIKLLRIGMIKPWNKPWTWYAPYPARHTKKLESLAKAAEDAGF